MSRELRILPEAEAELSAAAEWYESRQTGLGVAFVEAVGRALEVIGEGPQSNPLWREGYPYRRHVLLRFPYTIVFTVKELSLEVTAIAHAKGAMISWPQALVLGMPTRDARRAGDRGRRRGREAAAVAWQAEVERALHEVEDGSAELDDWEDVDRELQDLVDSDRS